MNADRCPIEPLGHLCIDDQGVGQQCSSVADEEIIEYAVRLPAAIVPEIAMLYDELVLGNKRANQVDHIFLPLNHRDPLNSRVRMEGVNNQAQAKTGTQDMPVVECGVLLHCPPMRRIVNHPTAITDQQSLDPNVLGLEIPMTA